MKTRTNPVRLGPSGCTQHCPLSRAWSFSPPELHLPLLWLVWGLLSAGLADAGEPSKVLVFSKTAGYRHASIADGLVALRQLATNNHFEVEATEDAAAFNDANLARFQAVVFLSTSGDVLDAEQEGAFQRYIRAGHGFVGIHAAADTETNWVWYGGLVGAFFSTHPAQQAAMVVVEDFDHPSTSFLPEGWVRTDEWYDFKANPRANVHVLCRLDEASYSGGTMGDHPIAWYHEFDGGRAWYTGGGHTSGSFGEPLFRAHLLWGLRYAAAMATPPPDALVLFNGTDASPWVRPDGRSGVPWQVVNGALVVAPGSNHIQTFQTFQDFRLHAEFLIPATPPGTPEASLGNSGIYLQGLYEMQIIDSYGRPLEGDNDGGSIWSIRNASTNASLPAGTWEAYDIVFRAARFSGSTKTAHARVSLWWNGVLVQDNVEIPRVTDGAIGPEGPGPGPILLQDLGHAVSFRNIWIQPLDPAPHGTPVTFIPPGSTWRYLDDGTDPGPAWRQPGFNDSSWSVGRAQLGYGDGDETTLIRKTRGDGTQIITTYFRKSFMASNTWAFTNLSVRMVRDDGIIAYLNGVELLRNNFPAGPVYSTTPAATSIGGADESRWLTTDVNAAILVEGTNWLAAELHQTAATSDASFDLVLSGVVYERPGLDLTREGQQLTVAWPALPAGFQLEAAGGLSDPQGWQRITNAPLLLTNKQSKLQIEGTNQTRFYRLRRQ